MHITILAFCFIREELALDQPAWVVNIKGDLDLGWTCRELDYYKYQTFQLEFLAITNRDEDKDSSIEDA